MGHLHGDAVHAIHIMAVVYVGLFLIRGLAGLHASSPVLAGLNYPLA